MKTLIVKYLPSGIESNTKKILDLFLAEISNKNSQIETIDLLKEQMPIFDESSIQAYYKRNYNEQKLSESETKLLAKNDALVEQVKSADVLVMAFPMHNFGAPAAAKAYLDAIVMKGETFDYGKKMMAEKKALVLFTSGGVYSEDKFNFDYPNWNSISLMYKANFNFMGFDDSEIIGASLRDETKKEASLNQVKSRLHAIVSKWYK